MVFAPAMQSAVLKSGSGNWRDLLTAFIQDHEIKVLNVAGPREAAIRILCAR